MHRRAITFATVIAALALGSRSAMATAGMVCDGLDDKDVFVEMNLPRSPGTPPNWVRVTAPGKTFTTFGEEEGAIALSVKQSFDDDHMFVIDLAEDLASDPMIKVRLLIAQEGDAPLTYIGYVQVIGQGIYPISCIEDE